MKNWLAGLRGAFTIAATYSVIAVIAYAVRGEELRARVGAGLTTVLAIYLLGACLAGSIVGWLLPVAQRSNLGAAIAGFLAMLPISTIVAFLVIPREDIHVVPTLAVIQAAFYGGLGGPFLRSRSLGH